MTAAPTTTLPGRVLVLMPTARDSERTAALLMEAKVPALICAELPDLCRELRAGADALLLTDEAIARDTAGQLPEALREQPAWSAVPVIVLAREGWGQQEDRTSLDPFKSLIIVERPIRMRTLVSVVRSALRARRHQYQIRDALLLRERQAAELRAQDERLRFALSAGGMGSWDLDLGSRELECSDICKANYGRKAAEPFSYRDLQQTIHPDDRARVNEAIERSVWTRTDCDVEYRICWPNGETRWLMVRGRATYDDAGQPRRLVGVSLDITERKRMHEALLQSESKLARQAEELLRSNRRKDEFLATLAHELRNPLAPIRTGMDLLGRSSHEQERERTLGVMQRQLAHMVRLIDDLLDVSRITRGKLELRRERVMLTSVINAAVEASRPLIERKQQTLRVSVSDGTLCLDADITRIAQVVGNLLNNASNYTPSGGSIELSAAREGDLALIQVRDNGIGIPADRLSDVFEMFSQIGRTLERSQGGLGIGLALVRSLVEMHGGSVLAESGGAAQGSTFSVRLPLASPAASAEPQDERGAAPESRRTSKRVLVVDDNEDAADLLTLVLEQAGYQSQTAYDGVSALSRARAFRPHVVVLDIGLPGMSGYDVARALREESRSAPLFLIALTGWGSPDDKQKATAAGFDLHLTKPVDARALHRALEQLDQRAEPAANLEPSP
jgi:signal transduction histidine kinase/DNA-binding response OmpR family regulator